MKWLEKIKLRGLDNKMWDEINSITPCVSYMARVKMTWHPEKREKRLSEIRADRQVIVNKYKKLMDEV